MQFSLPVILASASPRRRELLGRLIPTFTVVVSDVDEDALTTSDPVATAESLALAKAIAVSKGHPDALVIGGDTVVALGNEQLAKPTDIADAEKMLAKLSNRTHRVISGVALVWPGGQVVFSDTTTVTFRELGPQEITDYVATDEPMDKAGAYAIQGGAAGFVTREEGSRTNVIGLPLEKLQAELEQIDLKK